MLSYPHVDEHPGHVRSTVLTKAPACPEGSDAVLIAQVLVSTAVSCAVSHPHSTGVSLIH